MSNIQGIVAGAVLGVLVSSAAQAKAVLEEVMVTAQHRSQSLQDVPVSVSAMSGDKMIEAGINRMEDLQAYVPNLTVTESGISTDIFIRGIGTGMNQGFEQSVGMYVDGIYYGRAQLARAPFTLALGPDGGFLPYEVDRLHERGGGRRQTVGRLEPLRGAREVLREVGRGAAVVRLGGRLSIARRDLLRGHGRGRREHRRRCRAHREQKTDADSEVSVTHPRRKMMAGRTPRRQASAGLQPPFISGV